MKKTSLRAMPETKLAKFQTMQMGNDCAIHSIVAAIELLTDFQINPFELIEEVNRAWWRGRFFRLAPNAGITPPLQVRLINFLAKSRSIPIQAKLFHLDPEILRVTAEAENIASLVTLYWWFNKSPAIYYSKQTKNFNAVKGASGHTMLFPAYDPDHYNGEIHTPWGFINSWVNAGTGLFWMEDQEFRRSWSVPIPRWGNHATVVISRKDGYQL